MKIIQKNYKNKYLDNFVIIIISLIPLFLILGPFLPDLSISICAILFFIYLKKDNFFFDKNKKIFSIFFFIFYFAIIISSLVSKDLQSIFKSIAIIRFFLFTLLFWHILEKYKLRVLKMIFKICFIVSIFLIADSFIQFFTGSNILGYSMLVNTRVSSFFGDELILGSYIFRILCLLVGLKFIFSFNKNKSILFYFFLFLLFVIIFLSGERTALFFSILYISLFVLLKSGNLKYYILMTFLTIILSLYSFSKFHGGPKSRIFDSTFYQINFRIKLDEYFIPYVFKIDPARKVYIFSEQHETLYKTALNIYKDNRYFGIGIKKFREICKNKKYFINNFSCNTHPHNYYIQFLVETGGFVFALFFLSYLALTIFVICLFIKKFIFKTYLINNLSLSMILYYFVFLFPLVPSGSFFNNWISITFFYPLAILMWSFKNNDLKDI